MSRILVDKMPKEPNECPFSHKIPDVWEWNKAHYKCSITRTHGFYGDGADISDDCVGCDKCTKLKEI